MHIIVHIMHCEFVYFPRIKLFGLLKLKKSSTHWVWYTVLPYPKHLTLKPSFLKLDVSSPVYVIKCCYAVPKSSVRSVVTNSRALPRIFFPFALYIYNISFSFKIINRNVSKSVHEQFSHHFAWVLHHSLSKLHVHYCIFSTTRK